MTEAHTKGSVDGSRIGLNGGVLNSTEAKSSIDVDAELVWKERRRTRSWESKGVGEEKGESMSENVGAAIGLESDDMADFHAEVSSGSEIVVGEAGEWRLAVLIGLSEIEDGEVAHGGLASPVFEELQEAVESEGPPRKVLEAGLSDNVEKQGLMIAQERNQDVTSENTGDSAEELDSRVLQGLFDVEMGMQRWLEDQRQFDQLWARGCRVMRRKWEGGGGKDEQGDKVRSTHTIKGVTRTFGERSSCTGKIKLRSYASRGVC